MSFASKRKAIISWVKGASGYSSDKVIWLDQDMPRPSTDYIGVRLTSFKNIGREFVDTPDDTGKATIFKHKECTLNIHCYGNASNDPLEIALKIEDSQDIESQKAILDAQQIVVVDLLMGATNTSIKLDTEFEARASLDFRLRMPFEISDSGQGVIETVIVEGEVNNESGNLIQEQDFEIPA